MMKLANKYRDSELSRCKAERAMHQSVRLSSIILWGIAAFFMLPAVTQAYEVGILEVACGDSLITNTVLDADLSCNTNPAIGIGANNVELDCNGHTITYDTDGTGLNGIIAENVDNVTVNNCIIIDGNEGGSLGIAINLTGTNNSLVQNNTVSTNGTSKNYGILVQASAENNTLRNNTVRTTGTSSDNYGIYLLSEVAGNNVSGNAVITNGTLKGYGISLGSNANENTVDSNSVTTNGTSSTNVGVAVATTVTGNNVTNNIIITDGTAGNAGIILSTTATNTLVDNNTITTNGFGSSVTNNNGIRLQSTSNNNIVTNNNITDINARNAATANTNAGIYLFSTAKDNTISNNTISVSGSANASGIALQTTTTGNIIEYNVITTNNTKNHGIQLISANTNVINNNSISVSGAASAAISVQSSSSSFTNNVLNNAEQWIASPSGTNTFDNTTFMTDHGSILIEPQFSIANSEANVNRSNANVSADSAFINSSDVSFLNVPAKITLNNINFSNPKIEVDADDDGNFVDCNGCTEISYDENSLVYMFNVTGFTSYRAAENDTTPPALGQINITPTYGAAATVFSINISATDFNGVHTITASIQYPDGTNILTLNMSDDDADAVFNATWNSSGYDNQTYIIDIFANDTYGNNVTKDNIAVIPLSANVAGRYANTSWDIAARQAVIINATNAVNTAVEINSTVNITDASIHMVAFSVNPKNNSASATELPRYVDIIVNNDTNQNIANATIKLYYTDAEVSAAGLDESTLMMYRWNNSDHEWYELSSGGVDTTNNYVWANISGFSSFGIFGSVPEQTPEQASEETSEVSRMVIRSGILNKTEQVQPLNYSEEPAQQPEEKSAAEPITEFPAEVPAPAAPPEHKEKESIPEKKDSGMGKLIMLILAAAAIGTAGLSRMGPLLSKQKNQIMDIKSSVAASYRCTRFGDLKTAMFHFENARKKYSQLSDRRKKPLYTMLYRLYNDLLQKLQKQKR